MYFLARSPWPFVFSKVGDFRGILVIRGPAAPSAVVRRCNMGLMSFGGHLRVHQEVAGRYSKSEGMIEKYVLSFTVVVAPSSECAHVQSHCGVTGWILLRKLKLLTPSVDRSTTVLLQLTWSSASAAHLIFPHKA